MSETLKPYRCDPCGRLITHDSECCLEQGEAQPAAKGYTAGPWGVTPFGPHRVIYAGTDAEGGDVLADVLNNGQPERMKANAALIAAAPDLCVALAELADLTECYERDEGSGLLRAALDNARIALAKARGDETWEYKLRRREDTADVIPPDWQPIGTAPQDGSDILVCGGTYCSTDYNLLYDDTSDLGGVVVVRWCAYQEEWEGGYGWEQDVKLWYEPTWWMPLPEPRAKTPPSQPRADD